MESFEDEIWAGQTKLFDTMLVERLPASSLKIISRQRRVYGDAENNLFDEILKYGAFWREVLKPGGYATRLTKFSMVGERI